MKKSLLFLMAVLLLPFSTAWAADDVLIDYPNSKDGTDISGTTVEETVPVNGNELDAYRLKNGYSSNGVMNGNHIKLTLDEGFKTGDKITVAGCINSGETNKRGAVVIFSADAEGKATKIHTYSDFVDLKGGTTVTSLVEQTYTLEADVDGPLYLGRDGGTGTYVTVIRVERASSKAPVTLSFPQGSYSADIAEGANSFTAPSLTANPTAAASEVVYSSSNTSVATVDASTGAVTLVAKGNTTITAAISGSETYQNASATYTLSVVDANLSLAGYTEEIDGTTLKARALSSDVANVTIGNLAFGSNITDYKGTSKTVYIDNVAYTNTDSWRKNSKDTYENEYVGYTLTVAPGYKMNISHVGARIAMADDTYKWYVEILNAAGEQIWKSGEKTTKKADNPSKVVDADVTGKAELQGLTGDITVNLYVQQNGGTKYFSINYLQIEAKTEVDDRPTYAMTVSQNIEEGGEVTPADGSEVTEGESVAFTAKPATGYKFVKWVIDGQEITDNPYTIENVNAEHTAEAYFAKRFKVTYDLSDYAGTTTKVLNNINENQGYDEVYSDDNDKYTIPAYADKYLYSEGSTFDAWVDDDGNSYVSGDEIDMTKDITLTPIFVSSTSTLDKSPDETVVTWSFAKADILFVDWQSAEEFGYYTQTVAVNDEYISVPMKITAGKVGNWGRTDAKAQTNAGTTFTIPAVSGMKVEIADGYTEFSSTTIAGSTDYEGSGTKSISYIYEGSDETIDIVIGESNQYLTTIKVTYPAVPVAHPVEVELNQYGVATFFFSESAYIIPDGVTASAVESVTGTKLTLATVSDIIPAGCAVILEGEANVTYVFEPTDEEGTAPTNLLRGFDEDHLTTGEYAGDSYLFYALSAKNGVVGFYWMNEDGLPFTSEAHKAYLAIPQESTTGAANFLSFDVADGIQNVTVTNRAGAAYNLGGQRVDDNYKGIVIVDGVKVMRK